MDCDDDLGGSVLVVPTEEAIELMPDHIALNRSLISRMVRNLERQGMIEPIDLDDWAGSWGFYKVYAAVELGWETVIVAHRPRMES